MSRKPAKTRSERNTPGKGLGNKGRKEEQEQKGWRDVLVWTIPLAIGFILAFVGVVYSSYRWVAIVATVGAVIAFLAYFLFLAEWHVWQDRATRKRARILFVALSGGIVVAGAIWVYKVWTNTPEPYSIIAASQLGSNKRGTRSGVFWSTYKSKYGDTMSPAQLAIYIEIINLQNVPAAIDSYSVEALNAQNQWIRLTRVNVGLGDLFLCFEGGDLRHAKKVDTKNSFDYLLENKTLPPHEPVKGSAFFELPEDIQQTTPYRIHVEDALGMSATQISGDFGPSKNYVKSAPLNLAAEERDISGYYFRFFSDKSPLW